MTPASRAALRALAEKVTRERVEYRADRCRVSTIESGKLEGDINAEDAAFLALAGNSMLELLTALDRAEAVVAAAREFSDQTCELEDRFDLSIQLAKAIEAYDASRSAGQAGETKK